MVVLLLALLAICTSGCYVNKASVDPFSYAPQGSNCYWKPDCQASLLACREEDECTEIPSDKDVLSLGEVLDIAFINNPQTRISWARARQAAAEYGRSQSTAFPEITGDFFYTHSRTAYLASQVEQSQNVMMETLIINDQRTWGPQGHVTYTILDFGQRRYTSEAARYALYFADYTHNRGLQSLIELITTDYYNYLYEKKQLEANEADLANAEETLEAADLGLEMGARDISDVLQARTAALQAEIQLSEQRKKVNTAYSFLLDNMGLPATAKIKLQKLPFVDPESATLPPLDDYLETAMQCRPDLLASRATVESTEMSLKAAKRQWVPVVDYSLDVGRTYFNGGFHDNYDYTSTFTVSMPIFTGFYIRNSIKLAQAKVEESEADLKKVELAVIREVSDSYYNVGVGFTTLKAAIRFLKAAEEQYRVALSQYKAGTNTILDVTTAQASLFDARATQAEAIQQWFVSLATLTYTAGIISKNVEEIP